MEERKDRSNLSALLGIAVGLGVGYWLNSARGRQWREDTSKTFFDMGETLKEKASESITDIKEGMEMAYEKGRHYTEDLTSKVKSTVKDYSHKAENVVEDAEDAITKGAEKAKRTIKEQLAKVENNRS